MVRKGCSVDRHSPARMQSPQRLRETVDLQLAYHTSPSPSSSSSGSMEEPTAHERAFRPTCPPPLRQAGCWIALRGRMERGGQLVRHRETVAGEGKEGELMALMSAGSLGPVSSPAPVNAPSCHSPPPMRQAGSWVAWWGRGRGAGPWRRRGEKVGSWLK